MDIFNFYTSNPIIRYKIFVYNRHISFPLRKAQNYIRDVEFNTKAGDHNSKTQPHRNQDPNIVIDSSSFC